MPSLSSGSVGDTRGPDYTRMAIRAKWRKARASKDSQGMLDALDEAAARGSTVSGSVTQDEDQAMRSVAAQEARAAAAKLYMLRKASGNGPDQLKEAKTRLNAAGGESSVAVPQAPPTSAVAPGNENKTIEESLDARMRRPSRFVGNNPYGEGTGVGDSGSTPEPGGALTQNMWGLFDYRTRKIGANDKVPFGFRETGVAKGGQKMIYRVDEQGPESPESIEQGKPEKAMLSTTVDAVGKVTTSLSDYGREYLRRRYAKGVPVAVRDAMASDRRDAARNLEEQKTIRDATNRADAAATARRNAAAEKRRAQEMDLEDRKTAATDLRHKRTIAELEAGQQDVVTSMDALADEEDAADKRTTMPLPRNTRKIAGMLRPLKVYRAKQ